MCLNLVWTIHVLLCFFSSLSFFFFCFSPNCLPCRALAVLAFSFCTLTIFGVSVVYLLYIWDSQRVKCSLGKQRALIIRQLVSWALFFLFVSLHVRVFSLDVFCSVSRMSSFVWSSNCFFPTMVLVGPCLVENMSFFLSAFSVTFHLWLFHLKGSRTWPLFITYLYPLLDVCISHNVLSRI